MMAKVLGKKPSGTSRDIAVFRGRVRTGPPGDHFYVTLLGLRTYDTLKLLERVEDGLSYSALERFRRNIGLSMKELAELIQMPLRTLNRRREEGRLRSDESDRLVRAARIFGRALQLFEGDREAATAWLAGSQPALGGATPFTLAKTDVGAREVENLIGRLEHGIPS